jgi:hypothetical protein
MQVVENLLLVHDLDGRKTQSFDLKVGGPDFVESLIENCQVAEAKARKGKYVMDVVRKEEQRAADEAYKIVTKELKMQFH